MTGVSVSIRDLSIAFPPRTRTGRATEVLTRVGLDVPDGQFCTIVGPSGCGKSTMLSVLAGLLKPTGGRVLLDDEPQRGIDLRLGYMFQKDTLLPWATALQNVRLPMQAVGTPRADSKKKADELLALVGLTGFEHHYPRELSGGMRKRVQLARLLAQEPRTLLLDEPFAALDAQTKILMQEELLRLWETERKTVLFVTHDLQEAIALGDRVILMSARPARIKGDWTVDLPRPRDPGRVVEEPRFAELHAEIWDSLREEVVSS